MPAALVHEFEEICLGDARLDERARLLLDAMCACPEGPLRAACGSPAETKAGHRFFENPKVTHEGIIEPHAFRTGERCEGLSVVLAPQDVTTLDFTGRSMEGLGHLERKHMRGVLVNTGLFVTPDGGVLGVGYQEVWARDPEAIGVAAQRAKRAMEEKESARWPRAERAMAELLALTAGTCRLVVIADREGDIFEWLALPRPENVERMVRARHDRCVVGEGKLLSEVARQLPALGEMTVQVGRADERPARAAELVVRAGPVTLARPKKLGKGEPARCWCVVAEEQAPPPGAKPVFWVLLVSWEIASAEQAVEAVRWYARRWLVERFHFALKSGCKVEEIQPGATGRLFREVAMRSVVAALVLRLTMAARTTPDEPCTSLLDEREWKALYCRVHETMTPPDGAPTIREAVRMIARLAGFPGWKSAGEPGVKTIWQGLLRLAEAVAMYRIAVDSGYGPA